MKTTKILTILIFSVLFAITLNGCKKCKDEDPRGRIINNGTQKASVQIKTSGGNTVNINNVDPGTSSSYNSYAAGQTTFTIKVSNIDYVKTVDMSNCYDYEIGSYTFYNLSLQNKSAIWRFMKCYNEERLHGSLNYRTPEQFIKDFNENESKIKLGNENQITEVCQTVSDL